MVQPRYIWRKRESEEETVKRISAEYKITETTARLLCNRGIIDPEEVRLFLNPSFDCFHDPFLLKGMTEAVDRIIEAREQKQRVVIYGDYDVDGVTSTSILKMFLEESNFDVEYYIPDRLKEGYGINCDALQCIKNNGASLVISVDTGITAVEQAAYCKDINLDIIITDHHEPQEVIPDAIAVIDPKQEDCPYPFEELAGVGVTFKLIHALSTRLGNIDCIWKYLDIVAVGTVADIVPLINENRIIVKHAFETIPKTWNIGLRYLLDVSGYESDQAMTAGIIGFRVAPRLNAAGRLGDAKRGVELFTTQDEEKAREIAKALNEENANRQQLESDIYEEAVAIIDGSIDVEKSKILVVASEKWHHGVIGIVASRITEKYYRPSIILAVEDGKASGSARSVEGFSIFSAIDSCKHLLDKFGGHEMAAGMSLQIDQVEAFREALNAFAKDAMTEDTLTPKLKYDLALAENGVSLHTIDEIDALRPYGMGNPEPAFLVRTNIKEARQIGKEKNHLKLALGSKGIDAIGFGIGDYYHQLAANQECKVVGKLSRNHWKGNVKPQIMLMDLHVYDKQVKETYVREDFAVIYKTMVNIGRIYGEKVTLQLIKEHIYGNFGKSLSETKIKNCLSVFEELGLIVYSWRGHIIEYKLVQGKKVDLSSSAIYTQLISAS